MPSDRDRASEFSGRSDAIALRQTGQCNAERRYVGVRVKVDLGDTIYAEQKLRSLYLEMTEAAEAILGSTWAFADPSSAEKMKR